LGIATPDCRVTEAEQKFIKVVRIAKARKFESESPDDRKKGEVGRKVNLALFVDQK
jgi:hypothetical protein